MNGRNVVTGMVLSYSQVSPMQPQFQLFGFVHRYTMRLAVS